MAQKKIELLYKTEQVDKMLTYVYGVNNWKYDNKYWLEEDNWCTPEGTCVGQLDDRDRKIMEMYQEIIEKKKMMNNNWIAFQICLKRTCLCKSCGKFCNCANCQKKVTECDLAH